MGYAPDDSWAITSRGPYSKTTFRDGLGRTTSTSDSEGIFTTVRYDVMGQRWFKSYPFDATLGEVGEKQFFDGLGRVSAQSRAFRPTAGAVDQSGTCETPGACMVWTTYQYNGANTTVERASGEYPWTSRVAASFGSPDEQRLAAVMDSLGNTWQYTYGASGNLNSVLAPLSQGGRTYAYEPVTQFLKEETTGESGKTAFTRNAIGQVLTRTDARGVVATLGYDGTNGADPLGRLRSVTYQNGSADDVAQSWNNANNLETIGSPNGGAYTFVYDELNRVTQQTWSFNSRSYVTGYHYDANGCLDTVTQPTGRTLTMTCDTANRPTSVKLGNDFIVTVITYHPSGQVKSMTYGNGKVTDFVLDDRSRTKSITSGGVVELSYTYDGADNVKTMANGVVANSKLTMEYDWLDRLVTSYGPGQGAAAYDYDALGNRKFRSEGNTNHVSNYVYDTTTNRLTTATTESPAPSLKLTWDLPGRLASTSDGATYKYDARGKRVAKTDANGTTVYHYDAAGRVIAETTSNGDRLRDYVYVGNRLVAMDGCVDGATSPCTVERQWYHTDTLGSVLARTDATGAVVARLDYLPWGEQFNPPAVQGDRQYNGRVFDAGTGFHDYGARLYWPEIGRFVSADLTMGSPASPGTLNRYSYVLNNPYKYVDPDGREVKIAISRNVYSPNSITGTITVTSDVPGAGSFSGYTLETTHGGPNGKTDPIQPGTYEAFIHTYPEEKKRLNRVELKNVPHNRWIQIHEGNSPKDVVGCFAVGMTRDKDFVDGSKNALRSILSVIKNDGTGSISVTVDGDPKWITPTQQAGSPAATRSPRADHAQ
jgi:RHS repeat-associated protein